MSGQLDDSGDRYLALIKKTLQFSLWTQPPRPIAYFEPLRPSPFKRMALGLLRLASRLLKTRGLLIAKDVRPDPERLELGVVWPFPNYGETMIGPRRMDNLEYCMRTVIEEKVPGDLIETGVWRGGACIFMRAILAAYGITDRTVFLADSFEGLPPPSPDRPEDNDGDDFHKMKDLCVDLESVKENFRKYGLLDDQVVFLKGWFSDTLPVAPMEKIAVLRLDGDMYDSTMVALENLHPKVSPGGFVIIDDYNLEPCRAAVIDYRDHHGIKAEMVRIDEAGVFWRNAV
ncbi:MAG: TylF/MycF/NovP-related O-methyltransferase [Solirubrobacterales bacterium]